MLKTNLDTTSLEYIEVPLDYSLQTRNYMGYSDLDDPRLWPYLNKKIGDELGEHAITDGFDSYMDSLTAILQNPTGMMTGGVSNAIQIDIQSETLSGVIYAPASITRLENKIFRNTDLFNDISLNKIVPYMFEYYPTLTFADDQAPTAVVPEFYENYPIMVADELYEAGLKEKYHTVYKVWEGDSDTIFIVPDYASHKIYADVISVEVHLTKYDGLTPGFLASQSGSFEQKPAMVLDEDNYNYNPETGILTLDENTYDDLKEELVDFKASAGSWEVCAVLEIHIQKYRSIEDISEDLSEEELKQIGLMQSMQASVLQYLYQWQLAAQAQSKMNELAYTVALTVISTAILTSFTSGSIKEVVKSCVKESLEEVLRDPLIEAAATGAARYFGELIGLEDTKIVEIAASTLAESGRETATGIYTDIKVSHQNKIMKKTAETMKKQADAEIQYKIEQGQITTAVQLKAASKTSLKMITKKIESLKTQVNKMSFNELRKLSKKSGQELMKKLFGKEQLTYTQPNLFAGMAFGAGFHLTASLAASSQVEVNYGALQEVRTDLVDIFRKIADSKKLSPSDGMISNLIDFKKIDGEKLFGYAKGDMSVRELLDNIKLDKKPYVVRIGVGEKISPQDTVRSGEVIIISPITGRVSVVPQQRASAKKRAYSPLILPQKLQNDPRIANHRAWVFLKSLRDMYLHLPLIDFWDQFGFNEEFGRSVAKRIYKEVSQGKPFQFDLDSLQCIESVVRSDPSITTQDKNFVFAEVDFFSNQLVSQTDRHYHDLEKELMDLFNDFLKPKKPFTKRDMSRMIFPGRKPDTFSSKITETYKRGTTKGDPSMYAIHDFVHSIDSSNVIPPALKAAAIIKIEYFAIQEGIIPDSPLIDPNPPITKGVIYEYRLYRKLADVYTKAGLSGRMHYMSMEALSKKMKIYKGRSNILNKDLFGGKIRTHSSFHDKHLQQMYKSTHQLINDPVLRQVGKDAIDHYGQILAKARDMFGAKEFPFSKGLYGYGWHDPVLRAQRHERLRNEMYSLDGVTGEFIVKGVPHHIEYDKSQVDDDYLIWVSSATNNKIRDPRQQKYFGELIDFSSRPGSYEDMLLCRAAKEAAKQGLHPPHWGDKSSPYYNPQAIRMFYWLKQNCAKYGYKYLDSAQAQHAPPDSFMPEYNL